MLKTLSISQCHHFLHFTRFSGTWNHVAAVLFKIDFAGRNRLNNPACTSRECEWAAFRTTHNVQSKRVCEMTWRKPEFSESGTK